MSQLLIQKYLNDLSDLRRASGSQREMVVREAFKTLLKDWGKGEGLLFIAEYEHTTAMDERRYVDGALPSPLQGEGNISSPYSGMTISELVPIPDQVRDMLFAVGR